MADLGIDNSVPEPPVYVENNQAQEQADSAELPVDEAPEFADLDSILGDLGIN